MGQYNFGSGYMFAVPSGANSTPVQFGSLQEVTIGFSSSIKTLHGQKRFADAIGQGAMKCTGKGKFARIRIAAYNSIFFNETVQTGMTLAAINESGTVPANTPYNITVANSTTFSRDLGVVDALTGKPFTRVASAPTADQYSLANGIYTFASTNANKQVLISYLYANAASGYTITITNQTMGQAAAFMGIFNGRFGGKQITMILNSCVSSKLDLVSTKTEDFMIPEFDFEAAVDDSDILGLLSASE